MNENTISCKEISSTSSGEEMNSAQIYIVAERSIDSSVVSDLLESNADRMGRTVYFLCHYPIIAEEEKVLAKLSSLGFTEFIFCLSFDDPMMAKFKERLVNILERLGLEENESIEHDMVASSIKNMRKKLNDKVKFEKKAKSAGEWYSINVKPG
jgi:hypothetical protein